MTETASSTRETVGIITGGDFTAWGNVSVLISHNYCDKSEPEIVFLTRKTGDPAQIRYKFCGNSRQAILGKIHESLQNSEKTSTILFGVDGMGKTTTGIMYWKIYSKQYRNLIWITASSAEEIELWFRKIGEILKLSVNEDGTLKTFDMLLHEIYCNLLKPPLNDKDGRKKCLLIFDDADLTIIQKYLPPEEINPAVAILIITDTSPQVNNYSSASFPGISGSVDTIQLEEFNDDDISDYIEQNVVDKSGRSKETDQNKKDLELKSETSKLKGFCGGFPLALYQIVTYINRKNAEYSDRPFNPFKIFRPTHYGISQFATDFENQQLSPSDCDISDNDAAGNNHNQNLGAITIFTVWNHILKKMKKSKFSGLALEILKTMQLLNCDSIPRYLIYSLFPMKQDCNDLSSAISLLCEYSVIQDHEGKYLSIHRVFQKLPLPVPVRRPGEGRLSMRNIVEGLMPALLKLITVEEYSRLMFEDRIRSFGKINLQQVYRHIANSAEVNCLQAGSAGFSKDMFWSHGEHCPVSKGCVAVQLFTVLLGGVIVQELYQVLDGSHVKLNGHESQQTLSEWVALKSNLQAKGSQGVNSEVRSEQKFLFELYSVIATIPNPPVQLMRNSLKVISLANEGHTSQGAGLKLLFKAFQTFLREFKHSPDIITQFCKILGVSHKDLVIPSSIGETGTSTSSNASNSSTSGCAFPWSRRLSKDKICKLKELVKLMAVQLKSSSETAPEIVDDNTKKENHRIFPEEFVEATEKFFTTVIEQQGTNIQDIYVWFVWQYNAFKIVAGSYPGNDKLLTVLRNVTQIYEAINDRTIVERLLSL